MASLRRSVRAGTRVEFVVISVVVGSIQGQLLMRSIYNSRCQACGPVKSEIVGMSKLASKTVATAEAFEYSTVNRLFSYGSSFVSLQNCFS